MLLYEWGVFIVCPARYRLENSQGKITNISSLTLSGPGSLLSKSLHMQSSAHSTLYSFYPSLPVHTCTLARNSTRFLALSGKSPPMAESAPVITVEEIAEMERKNELRLRIKEEHLAALQFEGSNWKGLG